MIEVENTVVKRTEMFAVAAIRTRSRYSPESIYFYRDFELKSLSLVTTDRHFRAFITFESPKDVCFAIEFGLMFIWWNEYSVL